MIHLAPGRDRAIMAYHEDWVYSGSIAHSDQDAVNGRLVQVVGADGNPVGWGLVCKGEKIAARMVTFGASAPEQDWISRRIRVAHALRTSLAIRSDAYRLAHAEGDRIPGLFIDVYGSTIVVKPLIRAMELAMPEIRRTLLELYPGTRLYLKRDERAVRVEALELPGGYVDGEGTGFSTITENGLSFEVDLAEGQKTGFYLDQRENRELVRVSAAGRAVLNCFCYTGAFSVYAAAGNAASVRSVDISERALGLARKNLALNGFASEGDFACEKSDGFEFLEKPAVFDLVVLDPPPFARTRHELEGATKGYRAINRLALKNLAPGGLLFTFSCSGAVDMALFKKIIAESALSAGRDVRVLRELHAGPDHPFAPQKFHTEYLKGLMIHAD